MVPLAQAVTVSLEELKNGELWSGGGRETPLSLNGARVHMCFENARLTSHHFTQERYLFNHFKTPSVQTRWEYLSSKMYLQDLPSSAGGSYPTHLISAICPKQS